MKKIILLSILLVSCLVVGCQSKKVEDKWIENIEVSGEKVKSISINADINIDEMPDKVYKCRLTPIDLMDISFTDNIADILIKDWKREESDEYELVYSGVINEVQYTLSFGKYGFRLDTDFYDKVLGNFEVNMDGLVPSDSSECDGTNLATVSPEEAMKKAEEYIKMLGFDEYKAISCRDINWEKMKEAEDTISVNEQTEIIMKNGYLVEFARAIHDEMQDTSPYYYDQRQENMSSMISLRHNDNLEKIYVSIVDNGILKFSVYRPCTVQESEYKTSDILDIDEAKEKLKKVLSENPDLYSNEALSGKLSYTNLDLTYYAISSEEIIPVWKLSKFVPKEENDFSLDMYRQVVLINAFDGEVIDLEKNKFDE